MTPGESQAAEHWDYVKSYAAPVTDADDEKGNKRPVHKKTIHLTMKSLCNSKFVYILKTAPEISNINIA